VSTNQYFPHTSYGREQDLLEDLVIESIKIHGIDARYLPRTLVKEDHLFGEDTLSTFSVAAGLEVYIKNVEGFEGEGDFLSRFNLEIRDEMTLVIAKRRFEQIKSEKIMTEVGYNLMIETADLKTPSRRFITSGTANTSAFVLEGYDNYAISSERPLEGDLIYFPLNGKIFEIKHVEHEIPFYQLGRIQMYELKCELFKYSSEDFATGNTEIDAIDSIFSNNILVNELLQENGDVLLLEDGDSIIQEYRLEDTDTAANNEFFSQEAANIVNFSETNPFSERDRW
jgi:hypothetical protein